MRRHLSLLILLAVASCDTPSPGKPLLLEPQASRSKAPSALVPMSPELYPYAERADSVRAVKGSDARLRLQYKGIRLPDEEKVFFELFVTSSSLDRNANGGRLRKGESIWIKARLDARGHFNVVLEPAGLRFASPAELTFSFRLRDFDGDGRVDDGNYVKNHFVLVSRETDRSDWKAPYPMSISVDNQIVHVKIKVDHFTRFAMATN